MKKLAGVQRQITNYFNGYVKRLGGDHAQLLQAKEKQVCANVLLSLAKAQAFKVTEKKLVTHSTPEMIAKI